MRVGITLENDRGLESDVSHHFGQCKYFLIADVESDKVKETKIVPNTAQHGSGGCVAVDEILKHNVTHVIAGGMGMGAQNKFSQSGIKVFGFSGKAKDAIATFLKNNLGGLDACRQHGECS